jgi:hypothetical protein
LTLTTPHNTHPPDTFWLARVARHAWFETDFLEPATRKPRREEAWTGKGKKGRGIEESRLGKGHLHIVNNNSAEPLPG